jgi:hypothetical protein
VWYLEIVNLISGTTAVCQLGRYAQEYGSSQIVRILLKHLDTLYNECRQHGGKDGSLSSISKGESGEKLILANTRR